MDTPKKQFDAVLRAITPIMRAEFSLKKLRRTFYRYVSDMVQVISFTPSSRNVTSSVSFTGYYQIGHIFESQLYQNRDDSIDPTHIYAFEAGHIARWRIRNDEQIKEVAEQSWWASEILSRQCLLHIPQISGIRSHCGYTQLMGMETFCAELR